MTQTFWPQYNWCFQFHVHVRVSQIYPKKQHTLILQCVTLQWGHCVSTNLDKSGSLRKTCMVRSMLGNRPSFILAFKWWWWWWWWWWWRWWPWWHSSFCCFDDSIIMLFDDYCITINKLTLSPPSLPPIKENGQPSSQPLQPLLPRLLECCGP